MTIADKVSSDDQMEMRSTALW